VHALRGVFAQYMPNWKPPARSYATRVLGNGSSALVHMTDTPVLFGGELRIFGAVDLRDGRIVRWVDDWDSSAFDDALSALELDDGGQVTRVTSVYDSRQLGADHKAALVAAAFA
jgi:hypothetical protein